MNDNRTTVFYDGGCPRCLAGKAHFQRLDWAGRLSWVDLLQQPDALAGYGVDFEQAMEYMHVLDRHGRLRTAGPAFIALWLELPRYRGLAALLEGSGLDGLLDMVYRRMSRGRFARRCREGVCSLPSGGLESIASSFGDAEVTPTERRRRVRGLFQRIASRYDLMNDLMSFGIHRLWKRQLVWAADPRPGAHLLDLAGGTGDVARLLAARGSEVTVCDPSEAMMNAGRPRSPRAIGWLSALGEALPLGNASVDGVVIAFGLRNMTSPAAALAEARRVLRPGGRFVCLEFSQPIALIRPFYAAFSRLVIPALGSLVAGDTEAYRYLVASIRRFPSQETVAAALREAGFERVRYRNVSFGIGCVHVGHAGAAAAGAGSSPASGRRRVRRDSDGAASQMALAE